ncbi:MAG TPA: CRISPR-associated helicase Cas3' [Streptosporangiaceae bacterium]|nr:CRISPR-associated helicase Cas3' [Streptosporangiaceae bacterium]
MRQLWAHSLDDGGVKRHLLEDHLRGTASLARRFAGVFGAGDIAWWLGLLHDVGKGSCEWQDRLLAVEGTGGRVGVPHKLLGAKLAVERGLGAFAMAIDGHHGGLTTMPSLADGLKSDDPRELARHAEALRAVRALLPELAEPGRVPLPTAWSSDPLVAELALRLLFSALCDADYLDTAAHFRGADQPRVAADADFAVLRDRFEQQREDLVRVKEAPSQVDDIREEIYRDCVKAAAEPRGVFRLGAPTGSGKTIAAGGFAVHHAAAHHMQRVIVAVPFLTITEQNAEVYRRLIGDEVLEHHSAINFDLPGRRGMKLAAENWDAPFVVTTMVRLFESLFDRRPAAMRRVHRLAGAVIVLDEVQALPHEMLVPILDVLRGLTEHFGASVVLSSATQPDFWHLGPFAQLEAVDIVPEPTRLIERLRRAEFSWRLESGLTLEQIAAESARQPSALVVVNTTADAKKVYDAWRDEPAGVAWHLSTRMCGAHRRRVLAAVRERLADHQRVLLASTQLIEAGVDVDFPVVYRTLAPADSLLQAAGRANREGKLPQLGKVIIVDPPDGGRPPSYKLLQNQTRVHFGCGKADPDSPDALRDYYRAVYDALNLEDRRATGQRIQAARRAFDFAAVTDGPQDLVTGKPDPRYAFHMIDDDGVTLMTAEGAANAEERAEIDATVDRIRTAPRPDIDDLRALQPYLTTVHRSVLSKPGMLAQIAPILGEAGARGSLTEWRGGYDAATGITFDPRTEDFIY